MPIEGWLQQSILIIKWLRWLVCGYQSASFLSPFCHCPVAPEWSGHSDRDESYAWAQQRRFSFSKANLPRATTEFPICQQKKPTLTPWYGTILWGDQPTTWRLVDYTGPIPSWKGQHFVLNGIDSYSEYGFAFHCMQYFCQNTICEFIDALSNITVLHTAQLWDWGTCFTWMKCSNEPHACGIHYFYHAPHHPEAAGLIGWWNGL